MMRRLSWTLVALLASSAASAEEAEVAPVIPPSAAKHVDLPPDADGFKHPLDSLKFNPGLDQREFERATLDALNVYDPWESWNRRMYHFNYRFDEWVFLPVVNGYEYVTPHFVRSGVSNFFSNLGEVTTLVNSLLQLKPRVAANSTARLLFNTTFGILGVWDPATHMGLPKISEDFGQTLGYYGVPEGPYLMLPILGPSNVRDTTGLVSDYVTGREIDYLNVSTLGNSYWELPTLQIIDKRYSTSFRYGQMNTPFEYEKLRYFYTESRRLQIGE
ncbi:MAG: putative phospholipid-binding lipoprotein MlaA [Stenotrophomonas maltophilia]|nr:MAG: putative phospholipid-binding lipoprotein MlaA [Stenotrophomonas maltophilia]